MSERKINLVCFASGFALAAVICILGHIAFFRTDALDSARVEEYARRSEDAQNAVGRAEQGLGEVEGKLRRAGSEVGEGLAGLAGLAEDCGRIAGRNEELAEGLGRIEESIQSIMQVLEQGQEAEGVLDDGGRDTGGSGGG